MILILSTEFDVDTDNVCDWLIHYNAKFFRLHPKDLLNNINEYRISKNNKPQSLAFADKTLDIKRINVVWYRKWFSMSHITPFRHSNESNNISITKAIEKENKYINDYVFYLLKDKNWIDKPIPLLSNKLYQLTNAMKVGINIPDTILTSRKENISNFLKKHNTLITKTIISQIKVECNNELYSSYTQMINENNIDSISETFYPSLVQEKIEKEYEIRVFYLDGKCYSMAIFSQSTKATTIDYRNYDYTNPNRHMPYKLPIGIENKINDFMCLIGLRTGSLDFIYSKNNDYVFLEVNPSGIFNNISTICNYNLDKKIAEYLIEINK